MPTADIITVVIVAALSFGLTRLLIPMLQSRALIDMPNDRSSHDTPTPRGGGWAIILPVMAVITFNVVTGRWPDIGWSVVMGAVALAAVSWLDDVRSLGVKVRLLVQLLAVSGVIFFTPTLDVFPGVPSLAVKVVLVLGWVWFINLYNFMDGIDGITGIQTIAICIGVAGVYTLAGISLPGDISLALLISGATAGFLWWNWSPARIFMGDVGSVFLGFILGWMLIQLAFSGHWAAALILPMYYLADATITLCRRIVRGEKFWQAHREHFYQRAHQAGLGHNAVVGRILIGNATLVGLALYSVNGSLPLALGLACCATGVLLYALARHRRA